MMKWHMVHVYSATHFLVDFACAFFMFRSIAGTPESYLCLLLYNFCAFAMQMPLGIIADKWNRNFLFAILGCVFAGTAYGFAELPVAAVVIAGIGNAMFHLGAGIDVLNISEKKLGALGVFVSPGAFGIYLGTRLGRGGGFPPTFIPPALMVSAILIFIIHRAQKGAYPKNAAFSLEGISSPHLFVAAVCLFIVVCLRSFAGLTLDFSWKGIGNWGLWLICAVVLGKTMGGFIADQFGVVKTACISLGFAGFLFVFPGIPPAGVLAVLLFNMTMPITLWALAKLLPGAKGFAFGMLTFALFMGFLPVYLGIKVTTGASWFFSILSAGSLLFLWAGLRRVKL